MPRWRFWEKSDTADDGATMPPPPRTATRGELPPNPPAPHQGRSLDANAREQRRSHLLRRRAGALYDLEQAQLAHQDANPWQERIALLTEAIQTIETDLLALERLPASPTYDLPPTPVEQIEVSIAEPSSVSFRIGGERFHYEEAIDWAERGTTIVRGELHHRTGSPSRLLPPSVPASLADDLVAHLTDSLFAFAVDLRDRRLEDKPLPSSATLADLASPCPECGGWRDWNGICPVCKRRAWQRQQLIAEATRLEQEREREAADQEKWAERLPVAQRRLADIDAELAALGD